MQTGRRGFLGAMLALAAAPAIVRADSLMRIVPTEQLILWGDGIRDDTVALQALIDGKPVRRRDGSTFSRSPDGAIFLGGGLFAISSPIVLTGSGHVVTNCHFEARNNPSSVLLIKP